MNKTESGFGRADDGSDMLIENFVTFVVNPRYFVGNPQKLPFLRATFEKNRSY